MNFLTVNFYRVRRGDRPMGGHILSKSQRFDRGVLNEIWDQGAESLANYQSLGRNVEPGVVNWRGFLWSSLVGILWRSDDRIKPGRFPAEKIAAPPVQRGILCLGYG